MAKITKLIGELPKIEFQNQITKILKMKGESKMILLKKSLKRYTDYTFTPIDNLQTLIFQGENHIVAPETGLVKGATMDYTNCTKGCVFNG